MKKSVTIDEFDNAVVETATELTIDHMDTFQATLLFTTYGMAFASELRRKLFGEEKEQEDD